VLCWFSTDSFKDQLRDSHFSGHGLLKQRFDESPRGKFSLAAMTFAAAESNLGRKKIFKSVVEFKDRGGGVDREGFLFFHRSEKILENFWHCKVGVQVCIGFSRARTEKCLPQSLYRYGGAVFPSTR
jgi:hypothetical protein